MGIDLIWFGILLGVNMQTSFMHPPFGFALFYLRSVAPGKKYIDKITGKMMDPVTTKQIYWGAIPFVVIQIIMVALIIAFPGLVSVEKKEVFDDSQAEIVIEIDSETAPASDSDASPNLKFSTEEPGEKK